MKKLLLGLFLIPTICFGQDSLLYNILPLENGKVTYTKVVQIDSTNKDQLFIKVKEFAVNFYRSQKVALETEDKEAGFLAYKGYFEITDFYTGGIFKGKPFQLEMYHTLKFYIKDNKIKIVLTDFETISHDFASEFVSSRYGNPINRNPIENGYYNYMAEKRKGLSGKKNEKWENSLRSAYNNYDKQIKIVVNYISDELRKKKSAFDF